jgi:inorganic triphosphatase YgiF
MAWPREIELKLDVPAGQMTRLRQLPLVKRAAPVKRQTLRSVYFDTDKRQLRKRGLSLRIRQEGDRHVQTVKQQCGDSVGLFMRNEWQRDVDGREPDLVAARDTVLRPLIGKKLSRKLKPVFVTDVGRQAFSIRRNGSEIELALDQGKVEAGKRSSPLHQLELELKHGQAQELFALARALARKVPLQLASKSKGGLGYALIDKEKPQPAKAGPIALAADADWATAFQVIARACLYQLIANKAALHGGDLEALHQMRIALRRLRTAISLFSDMLEGPQTAAMKSSLKRLTAQLGPARELDVFVKRVVRRVEEPGAGGTGTGMVAKEFRERRAQALTAAENVTASALFRRLMLDVVAWIESGDWTCNGKNLTRECPTAVAAAAELKRRTRKIRKQGKHLAGLDPRRRHKLRVRAKKLRYACEFFADAFPGKKRSRRRTGFAGKLKKLQGALGDLNDIVVHQELAEQAATAPGAAAGRHRRRRTKKAFAAGRLAGREEARFASAMSDAERAYAAFARAKPFWS